MATTVTSQIQGITINESVKAPVHAVSTANLTLSGLQTVGGITLNGTTIKRVLVKDQTDQTENGIYDASSGGWTRSKDFDGNRDVVQGTIVLTGDNNDLVYRVTSENPIIIGTSDITVELSSLDITQGEFNSLLAASDPYKRTAAEIAAGVTPVSYGYQEGNAFRYMTAAQVSDVLAGTLLLDVTTAVQTVFDLSDKGADCLIPGGTYLITASLAKANVKSFRVRGEGRRSNLVNKASSNKPTIVVTDVLYFDLEEFSISGRAGFPNKGIVLTSAGGQTSSFWALRKIGLETNGNGIELVKVNTGKIIECEYWPSAALGIGSTRDPGNAKHAIFADAGISGNYCNEVHIQGCNLIGVDDTISGHANIKIADGGGGCQGINIWNCELEGAQSVIEINDAYNLNIKGCFVEGAALTLSGCRYSSIEHCYNWEGISFVGCINTFLMNHVQGPVTTSFTIDNTSSHCGAINAEFQNAPSDSGAGSIFINWTVAGTRQADRMGQSGIRERGRSIAIGEWATRSFAAGNYTATTGTWTVASGDRLTDKYSVNGKTVTYQFNVATSTTASSATALHILIPGGFTAGSTDTYFEYTYSMDNGTTTSKGLGRVIAGDTRISLYRDIAATAFSNVSDLLLVRGTVTFEVA